MGMFGNSEELETSPDNTFEVPGQEGGDQGAGPDQGQPGESQDPVEQGTQHQHGSGDDPGLSDPQSGQGEATHGQQGDDLILGKFKDPAALAQSYQSLEQLQGRLGQENAQLRQLVQQLYLQATGAGIQPPMAHPGVPNAPVMMWNQGMAAPNTPWASPGVPQQGANPWQGQAAIQLQPTPQTASKEVEQVDPEKWLEEFYEKGPQAVDARIEALANRIVEERLNQAAQQYLAPIGQSVSQIQEFVNQQAISTYYQGLARQAASEAQDFNDLRQEIDAVLQENPHLIYLPFQTGQNPYSVAYQEARRRHEQRQQQEQQIAAEKAGARMPSPSSSAGNRTERQPQDPERAYIQSLFQSEDDTVVGMYGQLE